MKSGIFVRLIGISKRQRKVYESHVKVRMGMMCFVPQTLISFIFVRITPPFITIFGKTPPEIDSPALRSV
jgi:hypothetical protein